MHGKDGVRGEEGRREGFPQAGREQADHGRAEDGTAKLRAAILHILAVNNHTSLLAETRFLGRDTPQPACCLRRVLVEDGTGEALVLCRNQHVAAMLGLSLPDWEAVQSCVQSRGRVSVQYGEAPGMGVSGVFWHWLRRAGPEPQLDWVPLCYGSSGGSLPPSARSLTAHTSLSVSRIPRIPSLAT